MKTRILILALALAGAVFATEPAPAKPAEQAPTLESVTKERDALKAEVASLQQQLAAQKAEKDTEIFQLRTQRNNIASDLLDKNNKIEVLQQALAMAKAKP